MAGLSDTYASTACSTLNDDNMIAVSCECGKDDCKIELWMQKPEIKHATLTNMLLLFNCLYGCDWKDKLLSQWKEIFAPGMLTKDDYQHLSHIVKMKWRDVSSLAHDYKTY